MGIEKPHITGTDGKLSSQRTWYKKKVAPLLDKGNGATGTGWYGRRDSNPQAYFSGKF